MRYVGVLSTQDTTMRWQQRLTNADVIRTRGTEQAPDPPRGLVTQPGPRGVLVSWSLPADFNDIVGWRVYKDTESSLFADIRDRGTRQYFIDSTAATSSPKVNIFVSSVNALGRESNKVQVQSSALSETGAPAFPVSNRSFTGSNISSSYSPPGGGHAQSGSNK